MLNFISSFLPTVDCFHKEREGRLFLEVFQVSCQSSSCSRLRMKASKELPTWTRASGDPTIPARRETYRPLLGTFGSGGLVWSYGTRTSDVVSAGDHRVLRVNKQILSTCKSQWVTCHPHQPYSSTSIVRAVTTFHTVHPDEDISSSHVIGTFRVLAHVRDTEAACALNSSLFRSTAGAPRALATSKSVQLSFLSAGGFLLRDPAGPRFRELSGVILPNRMQAKFLVSSFGREGMPTLKTTAAHVRKRRIESPSC